MRRFLGGFTSWKCPSHYRSGSESDTTFSQPFFSLHPHQLSSQGGGFTSLEVTLTDIWGLLFHQPLASYTEWLFVARWPALFSLFLTASSDGFGDDDNSDTGANLFTCAYVCLYCIYILYGLPFLSIIDCCLTLKRHSSKHIQPNPK